MFIGDKEIDKTEDITETRVKILFKDATSIELNKNMYEASRSEVPIDASTLRDKRCMKVTMNVLKLLKDWDIQIGDVQYVTSLVITSITEFEKLGDEKKWGKKRGEVTFEELDRVLKGIE